MGQPKLLLPMGPTTVIGRLLGVLSATGVEPFVLIRADDEALLAEVDRTNAIVVQPDQPPAEMRESIEHLLREIQQRRSPQPDDGWLLIPADHPLLSASTLAQVIDSWRKSPTSIVVPACKGQRGHPTLLPWSLAAAVETLPPGVGVNRLIRQSSERVREVPVNDATVTMDLDTPADYQRAIRLLGE